MSDDPKIPRVRGVDLQSFLQRHGPFRVKQACAIALKMARALKSIHEKQMIHGDLNPSNVLLMREGDDTKVVLIDFALARKVSARPTEQGAAGSLTFEPPELLETQNLGLGSDVFSLGVILAALIHGESAVQGNWDSVLNDWSSRPDIDKRLVELVRRMLSTDPHRRPRVAEIVDNLSQFASASDLESLTPELDAEIASRALTEESQDSHSHTPLEFYLDPGTATSDEVSELLYEISKLYRLGGGRGIQFAVTDAREPVFAEDLQ